MISLSGKHAINTTNLSGKNNKYISQIPYEINKLKIRILDMFILPLLSRQIAKIQENRFLLDSFKEKLLYYYKLYKIEELLLYKELLSLFEVFADQQIQLEEVDKESYKNNTAKNDVITMIYRTTMIKIKPEYELYNSILGRPKRELNETYREEIIKDIQKCMIMENITFKKMKEIITNKYLNPI
jgi:hypothetical protein